MEHDKEALPDMISSLAESGEEYVAPAMVRVSGGDESDMGGAIAIGAAAVWVIGIGPVWVWT
jgi:hypothetical protein